jgi:hypothetical protein
VLSIFQVNLQALLMIILSGYTEPMSDFSAGCLNLVNEVFVLLITYHLYQFTDFMADLAVRDLVGKSIIYTTFANVGINIGFVALQTAFALTRKLKLGYLSLKRRFKISQQRKK